MRPPRILVYCGVNNFETFGSLVPKFDLCFGFEADPELARKAQARFSGHAGVHVVHAALCDRNGTIQFNVHDNPVASSLGRLTDDYRESTGNRIQAVRQITVPAINLYDYLVAKGIHYIDLYYSDIQGMDFTVLCTIRPMIRRRAVREITCETEREGHGFQAYEGVPSNRRSLFDELLGADYRIAAEQAVMPTWAFQDVTWRLKPRHLLAWPLRRAGLGELLHRAAGSIRRERPKA